MTERDFIPEAANAAAYREALGSFATGVTVVTAQGARGPVAITANSFVSVSLAPPLVLWCPARASMRHDVFVAADRYLIHVMADDQQGIAAHFARSGEAFDGLDWAEGAHGLPVLAGALARFLCARRAVHEGGDHSIVVGEVERVWHRPGQGLIFKHGIFGDFSGRGSSA